MHYNESEILQDARVAWVLDEVGRMKLRFPVAVVSEKTGYNKSTVSNYLSKKTTMSLEFIKKFCESFEIDFDALNHLLIEKIKMDLIKGATPPQQVDAPTSTLTESDEKALNSVPVINQADNTMDSRILSILERYSIAEMHRTEAELLREKSFERITAILDRYASPEIERMVGDQREHQVK